MPVGGDFSAPEIHPRDQKIYLITRADLSTGAQLAQTAHVIADFTAQHPTEADTWRTTSNSLIVVAAPTEQTLYNVISKAHLRHVPTTIFREPDYGNEITAVALAPGKQSRRLCANFPLAGTRGAPDTALARERAVRALIEHMEATPQTDTLNVYEHGIMVHQHYEELITYLQGHPASPTFHQRWRLPDWIHTHRAALLADQPDDTTMAHYLTLHDCGKPAALTIDPDGKRHYPNHAATSEHTYRALPDTSPTVAELIGGDMLAHTLTATSMEPFARNPHAAAWLLSALAEIHANATMFGGVDSTSFKIKWKRLNSKGRQICERRYVN